MRKLELKSLRIELADGNQAPFETRERLIEIVRAPASGKDGMTVDEMGVRIEILNKLKGVKNGDTILIEEAEHQALVPLVKAMKWIIADPAIIEFTKLVENAPKTTVAEAA
jgi:hypothetical protein